MVAATDAPDGVNAAPRSRSQRTRRPSPAAAGGADQPPQQEQRPEEQPPMLSSILNWLLFFFLMQNVVGPMIAKFTHQGASDSPAFPPSALKDDFAGGDGQREREAGKPLGATPGAGGTAGATNDKKKPWEMDLKSATKPSCLWLPGTVMDLEVIISDSSRVPNGWPELTTPPEEKGSDEPSQSSKRGGTVLASWKQNDLILGGELIGPDNRPAILSFLSSNANNTMNYRNTTLTIPMTQSVWNNETHVYAYVRLQRLIVFKDGTDSRNAKNAKRLGRENILVKRIALTRYRKRKKGRDVKSLLDAPSTEDDSAAAQADPNDTSVLTAASLNKTHDQILLYMKPR